MLNVISLTSIIFYLVLGLTCAQIAWVAAQKELAKLPGKVPGGLQVWIALITLSYVITWPRKLFKAIRSIRRDS